MVKYTLYITCKVFRRVSRFICETGVGSLEFGFLFVIILGGAAWGCWLMKFVYKHFVHHHPNPKYTNSNYAFVYSIWDRAFGTYTPPDTVAEKGLLGLDYETSTATLIVGFPDRRTPSKYAAQPERKSA